MHTVHKEIQRFYQHYITNNDFHGFLRLISESRNQNNYCFDLIVSKIDAAKEFFVFKGSNDPVRSKQCWIGDIAAFSKYQAFYHEFDKSNEPIWTRMSKALGEVIQDTGVVTVDGFPVHLWGKGATFAYVPYICLASPTYTSIEGDWNTVDWGDAARGGYGYTTVTPAKPGITGFGVFFFQGHFGFYHNVCLENGIFETLQAKKVTLETFLSSLKRELGFELEHCGSLR